MPAPHTVFLNCLLKQRAEAYVSPVTSAASANRQSSEEGMRARGKCTWELRHSWLVDDKDLAGQASVRGWTGKQWQGQQEEKKQETVYPSGVSVIYRTEQI